jgi:hypothetical protein
MSDIGFLPLWSHRSVYHTLNLPQEGRQVLGADLNCSESVRRAEDNTPAGDWCTAGFQARECPLWVDPVEKGLVNIDES